MHSGQNRNFSIVVFVTVLFYFLNLSQLRGQKVNRFINAFTCTLHDVDYLVIHQSIFEPESRSYEFGNLRSSGYNTSEIVIYRLTDGSIAGDKKLGRIGIQEHSILLGYSNETIWAYSLQKKQGFKGLTFPELETKTTFGTFMSNRDWTSKYYQADVNEMARFFSFDDDKLRIIFTDTLKNVYSFDPFKYNLTKDEFIYHNDFRQRDYFTKDANIGNTLIGLSSGTHGYLTVNDNAVLNFKVSAESALIKASTIKQKKSILNYQAINNQKLLDFNIRQLDSLSQLKIPSKPKNLVSVIERLEETKKFYSTLLSASLNTIDTFEILLTSKENYFFVLSNANKPHEGTLMIQSYRVDQNYQIEKNWETLIDGIPFLNNKTSASEKFQKAMLENEPDFGFTYFNYCSDCLIGIYALNIFVIDIATGKLLWKVKNIE
jgi:hypothetical protein